MSIPRFSPIDDDVQSWKEDEYEAGYQARLSFGKRHGLQVVQRGSEIDLCWLARVQVHPGVHPIEKHFTSVGFWLCVCRFGLGHVPTKLAYKSKRVNKLRSPA
jgi:hypothetical protein